LPVQFQVDAFGFECSKAIEIAEWTNNLVNDRSSSRAHNTYVVPILIYDPLLNQLQTVWVDARRIMPM
jgi:hypothetical protein